MNFRYFIRVALIALTAASIQAGAQSASPAVASRKLIVAMGHQAIGPYEEAFMFAVPKQLGWFQEEGLDVSFEPTGGSGASIQLVVGGRADMGLTNGSTLFNAVQRGAKVKLVHNVTRRYASGLAVLPDSVIKTPADLKGKLIGVASLASGRIPEAKAMIVAAGLKPDVDVRLVAVGTGAQAAAALSGKQVDGLYLWDLAYSTIEQAGVKLRVIRDVFPEAPRMLDFMTFAPDELIQREPKVLQGFGRAAAKGILFCISNPSAALELFYRQYPDQRTRNDDRKKADLATLEYSCKLQEWRNQTVAKFGYFPPENVTTTGEFLVRQGEVGQIVDAQVFYTNAMVDGSNAFDVSQVIDLAKNWK